jgi:hypothetical protein
MVWMWGGPYVATQDARNGIVRSRGGRSCRGDPALLVALDLALFLPAVLTSGVMLLRHGAFGYLTAPGLLVFLALTCLPVLVTPIVAVVRGHEPSWDAVGPLGVVLLLALAVLTHGLQGHTTGEEKLDGVLTGRTTPRGPVTAPASGNPTGSSAS